MNTKIGVQESVTIGKETTAGTAVAGTETIPTDGSQTLGSGAEYTKDEQARGSRAIRSNSEISLLKSEPGWTANVFSETFGRILEGMFGSVSSAANADASSLVYDHTYSVLEDTALPTYTIRMLDGIEDIMSTYNVVNELTINFSSDNRATYTVSYMGQKQETATGTPAYDADDAPFRATDAVVKLATSLAGLDAASSICVLSGSITFTNNVQAFKCTEGDEHSKIVGTTFEVSGSLTLLFEDGTYRDFHLDGTKRSLRIDLTNTGDTIGTAANPQLQIDVTQAAFEEFDATPSATDTMEQTLGFQGEINGTIVSAILTNLTASY